MHNYPWMYQVHPYNCNQSLYPCTYWEYPSQLDYQEAIHSLGTYHSNTRLKDYGANPYVVDIHQAASLNKTFRTAIWTGKHLQVTLMSIDVADDIGLEIHHDHDQFLRIEAGEGFVQMGDNKEQLTFQRRVGPGSAIMVPAGQWHNIKNIGDQPLKLYSIYAPPEHEFGTVHPTKTDALESH